MISIRESKLICENIVFSRKRLFLWNLDRVLQIYVPYLLTYRYVFSKFHRQARPLVQGINGVYIDFKF